MAATTENSKREYNRRDFLKFVNAGVILAMLTSCIPDDHDNIMPTQLHPSPNPNAPTSAPIEEDISELPDGIEEIAPTPTATEIIPQYTLTPEIENFRESYIPVEELLDGSYWNWLNETIAPTLLEDFKAREDQLKYVELGVWAPSSLGAVFVYETTTTPNYPDEEVSAPWNRKVTFGATSAGSLEYLVLPVFYYDKESQRVYPVVTVSPIRRPEVLEEGFKIYLDVMNIPVILFTQATSGSFEKDNIIMEDPIVGQVYDRLGQDEIWERLKRFRYGDVSALSDPEIVVLATAADTDFYE